MRTYCIHPVSFVALLVVCLALAPSRRLTGDEMASASPLLDSSQIPVISVGSTTEFADLCRNDPLRAVAASLSRYERDVDHGYSCIFVKRERIKGKLHETESIACDFRASPFSVLMHWVAGKDRADAMLYVSGDNNDDLLIVPANDVAKRALRVLGKNYAKRKLTSADALEAARYPASQFGIKPATERVYSAWKSASDRGALRVEYLGVQKVPELRGRTCHVLRRTCLSPEEDGLTEVTIYLDSESELQVGAVLLAGKNLIASYFYQDVRLNPRFGPDHFSASRLK